jgi:hypothetical protein
MPALLRSLKHLPGEISERTPGQPHKVGGGAERKRKDRAELRMPTQALNLFPAARRSHGPNQGKTTPLTTPPGQQGWTGFSHQSLGHPASQVSIHWSALAHSLPAWKQGWKEAAFIASDTETEWQDTAQPAGNGEPAKCTPKPQKPTKGRDSVSLYR